MCTQELGRAGGHKLGEGGVSSSGVMLSTQCREVGGLSSCLSVVPRKQLTLGSPACGGSS